MLKTVVKLVFFLSISFLNSMEIESEICPMCLRCFADEFSVQQIDQTVKKEIFFKCSHPYCRECFIKWLQQKGIGVTCPLCEAQIANFREWEAFLSFRRSHDFSELRSRAQELLFLHAVRTRNMVCINELLVFPDVSVNMQDMGGYSALMVAAMNGDRQIVRLLLAREDLDLDMKEELYGYTALRLAIDHQHEEIVGLLLDHGANPNIKDVFGYTVLIWAAINGYAVVVKRLLTSPLIDLNIKTARGLSALDLAKMYDHWDVVDILQDRLKCPSRMNFLRYFGHKIRSCARRCGI